uniref:Replication initiation protein n=1 Tax=Salmonella sp. TaxID=599 RepID=A0A482EVT8_SALSP|nr:RepB family plasmid replication initiator protein [Salmonella sp.]QBM91552.1 Replication initiation protein [Salmonella sp.]
MPSAEASKDIRRPFQVLARRKLRYITLMNRPNQKTVMESYPWMIKDAYSPRRGTYIIHLNRYLMPFFTLLDKKRFTKAEFTEVSRLTNPYSMRLFMSPYASTGRMMEAAAILASNGCGSVMGYQKSYQR